MPSTLSNSIMLQTDECEALLGNANVLPIFVGSEEAFLAGHIPGSALIRPKDIVCGVAPATGKLPDADDLADLFSRIGLTPETIVIAYDDEGGGWAGRLIWTLDVIGHTNYHYLDGGSIAWLAEGRASTTTAQAINPSDYAITIDRSQLITADAIIAALDKPDFIVWDARSAEEHAGTKVLAAKGGHIPGAANLDWLDLIDRTNHSRLKPLDEIKQMLAERNIANSKAIVTHCQTHHRSGLTYLVGKILGLNIKAYDGSWSEWGNLEHTPVNTL